MGFYLREDIATVPRSELKFSADEKSQRAEQASRVSFDASLPQIERDTLFQIVFMENTSHSMIEQLDELQLAADAESVGADRLRYGAQRIVRQVDVDPNEGAGQGQNQEIQNMINNEKSTFKLTLQDCSGNFAYGIELTKLTFLNTRNIPSGFPVPLGAKLIVKAGTTIFQGVILLEKDKVEYLAGLVPAWAQDAQQRHIAYFKKKISELEK